MVVTTFNCTSPTPQSLFDALEKELVRRKSHPPVQNFSQAMVISLDVTVVGILGVVSRQASKLPNISSYLNVVRQNAELMMLVSKSIVFLFNVSSLERKRTSPDNVPVASSGEYSRPKHWIWKRHDSFTTKALVLLCFATGVGYRGTELGWERMWN